MKVLRRMIDLELTNRCNALCSFCPRAATPEQGFMTFDTFKQAVARAKEVLTQPRIALTGQGESTLHPELIEFVRYATNEGVVIHMTTNANLLNKEKSRQLIEAGLMGITFSVSDFDEDYELVYNLNFEKTRTNILDFLDLREEYSEQNIGVAISIVIHDLNKHKIDDMKAYWKEAGIAYVMEFPQNNRGGACNNAHYFLGNTRYLEETQALFSERKISTLCCVPFHSVFIGWNGQYYICCSDYRKQTPLGSVFDYSIDNLDQVKLDAMGGYMPACSVCNVDPVNAIREKMFELEMGDITQIEMEKALEFQITQNDHRLPKDIDILKWRDSISHA